MQVPANYLFFTESLYQWHVRNNTRKLPWKNARKPYKIWISEILLQQTRAEQAIPYYTKFISAYPTIQDLAKAPMAEVYKLWQGLGYYNRCNNMLATAQYISKELNGKFPNTYENILALKGVGPYTASAIASFAYNLPYAVVDGNVYRILSRYFGLTIGFFTASDKQVYTALAQKLLPNASPARHNQAIMDFGATICKPALPQCNTCVLKSKCKAFKQKQVSTLPLKKPKIKITERHFHYLVISVKGQYYLRQRTQTDIWKNLHEFYLLESTNQYLPINSEVISQLSAPIISKQKLTHQHIHCYFYTINKWPKGLPKHDAFTKVSLTQLQQLALPKSIAQFVNNHIL